MSDLIRRQDVIDAINEWDQQDLYLPIHFKEILYDLPSAEPERKKGKWLKADTRMIYTEYVYECSECGAHHSALYDFCPTCGARMDGDEDEKIH